MLYICSVIKNKTTMTTKQQDTVSRLTKIVERLNGKQTVSVNDIRKGHISLTIFNVRDKVDFIRTTTFVDVDINTNGRVVKGFINEYSPKESTVYPYTNI